MTAPEPSTGTQDLAEKVARTYWERAKPGVAWEQLPEYFRNASVIRTVDYLDAVRAAGLAVVELPEPDAEDSCIDPREAVFRSVDVELRPKGAVFIDLNPGPVCYRTVGAARAAAADLLAAVAWTEHQGGDPR